MAFPPPKNHPAIAGLKRAAPATSGDNQGPGGFPFPGAGTVAPVLSPPVAATASPSPGAPLHKAPTPHSTPVVKGSKTPMVVVQKHVRSKPAPSGPKSANKGGGGFSSEVDD